MGKVFILIKSNISSTTPKSLVNIIEIVMILSEDEDEGVSLVCQKMLVDLTEIVSETVLENSEENFYKVISTLPRIFNSIGKNESKIPFRYVCFELNYFRRKRTVAST